MSKYFLYHRVSKKIQSTDGQGMERQTEATEKWIEIHNESRISEGLKPYIYGRRYEDKGRSGYTEENIKKGQLGKLFCDIENGRIEPGDIIVFELIDRFSRAEPGVVREHLEKIMKAGVKVAITKWNIVFSSEMQGPLGLSARIMLEIGLYLANEESRIKSERIQATIRQLERQGIKSVAKTPIWLHRTKDRRDYRLIDDNVKVIQKIFELRKLGLGAKRIINEIGPVELPRYRYDENGDLITTTSNKPLCESAVNRYLRDEAVLGYRDGKKIYDAIVDEKTFNSCQQKISKTKGGKVTVVKNVLSGIVYCDHCNKKMAFGGEQVSKFGKVRSYIKCNGKTKANGCNAKDIKYAPLESSVYNLLKHIEDKQETTVDINALESEMHAASLKAKRAMTFMLDYDYDSQWKDVYEEQHKIINELKSKLSQAKAERAGKLTELDLDLSQHKEKAKFNQILKDYDVKAYLGHDPVTKAPYVRLIIGAWNDFEARTTIGKDVNAKRVKAGMRLGAKGINFDIRERGHIEFHEPEVIADEDLAMQLRIERGANLMLKVLTDEQKKDLVNRVKSQSKDADIESESD
ncbi:TPA: recombinase family protein [Vibrio parahaemolyticus]|nr:recombinase family protein [Vibrio parahaemolyticus]